MSWVGEAYKFGGANCWIGMGTRKYSKMIADSKPASKCPKMSKALFRIRWTPTPGSPGSSLCHTPSPGLEHPWRMRPSSRADIVSRAGRHQFHQQLEKEVRHSAWQDAMGTKGIEGKVARTDTVAHLVATRSHAVTSPWIHHPSILGTKFILDTTSISGPQLFPECLAIPASSSYGL